MIEKWKGQKNERERVGDGETDRWIDREGGREGERSKVPERSSGGGGLCVRRCGIVGANRDCMIPPPQMTSAHILQSIHRDGERERGRAKERKREEKEGVR
jgi:hypothetical protein